MGRFLKGALLALVVSSISLMAGSSNDNSKKMHHVVIHIDRKDTWSQTLTVKNVENVIKALGKENTIIEVVAYGPGIKLMEKGTPNADTVRAMAHEKNIRFSVCENTIKAVAAKTGKTPKFIDGVTIVPSGIARITELEEQGYTYIKP